MSRWLHSGLRRDICVVVADLDAGTDREVKTTLERQYDERVSPSQFQDAVNALVRQGYLDREVDGVQDRLSLTDAGDAALRSQYEWLREVLEDR